MSDVYGNEILVPEYRKCSACGEPMTMVIHMINSADPFIRKQAHKFQSAAQPQQEGLREALRYAVHKPFCSAYPATSEEQILRDCNCGFVKLFGWSSNNVYAIAALTQSAEGGNRG